MLSQASDLIHLVQHDFPEALTLDSASGAQLDALGAILNAPRPEATLSDEDYRFLLRARIAVHHWDGTNESLPAVLEKAFPGRKAKLIDNMNGTVTVSLSGSIPASLSLQDLFPVPAGIRLTEEGD